MMQNIIIYGVPFCMGGALAGVYGLMSHEYWIGVGFYSAALIIGLLEG